MAGTKSHDSARDRLRKERSLTALATVVRRLGKAADYFVVPRSGAASPLVAVRSLRGKLLAEVSHPIVNGWHARGFVTELGEDDAGRLHAITPQGHAAVREFAKRTA